jgi:hypothetical protein
VKCVLTVFILLMWIIKCHPIAGVVLVESVVVEAYSKCVVLDSGPSNMDIRLLNAEELSSNGES